MSKLRELEHREISRIARISEQLDRCKLLLARGQRRTLKDRMEIWDQVSATASQQACDLRPEEPEKVLPLEAKEA